MHTVNPCDAKAVSAYLVKTCALKSVAAPSLSHHSPTLFFVLTSLDWLRLPSLSALVFGVWLLLASSAFTAVASAAVAPESSASSWVMRGGHVTVAPADGKISEKKFRTNAETMYPRALGRLEPDTANPGQYLVTVQKIIWETSGPEDIEFRGRLWYERYREHLPPRTATPVYEPEDENDRWNYIYGGNSGKFIPDIYALDTAGNLKFVKESLTPLQDPMWPRSGPGYRFPGLVSYRLAVTASSTVLRFGSACTLSVSGMSPQGLLDLTGSPSLTYSTSHPDLIAINEQGVVTLLTPPRFPQSAWVVVAYPPLMKVGFFQVQIEVAIGNDADGDGMTDAWEMLYGFDPLNASDAAADRDGDGLSNLEEFQRKTNPLKGDTDHDGFADLIDDDPLIPEQQAPVLTLISPTASSVIAAGQTLSIRFSATDNAGVRRAGVSVDGLALATTMSGNEASASYHVPSGRSSITIAISARDYAGNQSVSEHMFAVTLNPPDTQIVGRIVDTSNVPINGALVALGGESSITVGVDGQFSFDFVRGSRNSMSLLATASIPGPVAARRDIPLSAAVIDVGNIQLVPATLLRGRVLDLDLLPVASAYVHLLGGEGSRTDGDGNYLLLSPLGGASTAQVAALFSDASDGSWQVGTQRVVIDSLLSVHQVPNIIVVRRAFENQLGTRHQVDIHQSLEQTLPFPFPWYGLTYQSMYLNGHGTITFGQPVADPFSLPFSPPIDPQSFLGGPPALAPYYGFINAGPYFYAETYGGLISTPNEDPGVGIYANHSSQRSTLTWLRVRHSIDASGELNSFQVELKPTGVSTVAYTRPIDGEAFYENQLLVGVTPGGNAGTTNPVSTNLSVAEDLSIPTGRAVYEQFMSTIPDFDLGGKLLGFHPHLSGGLRVTQSSLPTTDRTLLIGRLVVGGAPLQNVTVQVASGTEVWQTTTDIHGSFGLVIDPVTAVPAGSPRLASITVVQSPLTILSVGVFPGVINVVCTPEAATPPPTTVGQRVRWSASP